MVHGKDIGLTIYAHQAACPVLSARMKLVFIYGPPASGKLTVASELASLTGFKLFHNHISIQFVQSLFEFGTKPFWKLTDKYRLDMLEEAAKHGIDTIFTFVYGGRTDDPFVRNVIRRVDMNHGKVYFVRLQCAREELEKRVKAKTRKALGKIASRETLRQVFTRYDLESEVPFKPSLTINTTQQLPKEAARAIAQFYNLPVLKKR